jgi:peptide-methionine (S)-S-oxide reductase
MTEIATLGGGCFWCVEAVYQGLRGVEKVESGYSGGTERDANYKAVCSGLTQHVEVIQVHFDPEQIAYADILEIFFTVHDPTTPNRQGNDVGPQYRSAIFYASPAQAATAQAAIQAAQPDWANPIVTEVRPFERFFKAEDYHQNYFADNPYQPYCSFVVAPKVRKFRQKFADRLK